MMFVGHRAWGQRVVNARREIWDYEGGQVGRRGGEMSFLDEVGAEQVSVVLVV